MMRHQQKMQCLGFFEEAIGILNELTKEEEFLNARVSEVVFELPTEMENKLRPLIGTRIGILRTDIPGKEYLIRVLPGFGQETESMNAQDFCENEHASNCCEVI